MSSRRPARVARPRPVAVAFALLVAALGAAAAAEPLVATPEPPAPPGATAPAEPQPPQRLPPVQIQGNYLNAVGSADAASQGVVTSKLIEGRPTLRPAEVLEFIPGVIVTQHSGDGKANQYFLRGFNLDHGTDFATFVDGMPVNMPSHAHGQGYSDLNWLIPELVDRIAYRKGPYFAEDGDFASAGSARIRLFDALPRGVGSATIGAHGYARTLVANDAAFGAGRVLYALEAAHNDGPWDHPEKFHRVNGVLRYSLEAGGLRQSFTAMAYAAGWNATDQVPQRAVASGAVGRFGAIDPSDGGETSRVSLSYRAERTTADGSLRVDAYAIRSRLKLWSNFTYFLEQPVDLDPAARDGDQFEQAERRTVVGFAASRAWNGRLGGRDMVTTLGVQGRHDRLDPVGLYATVQRQRIETTQESKVRETALALYGENAVQWTPWLRSIVGLRADRFDFDVQSSIAANSGRTRASLVSPKLSLILGPWTKTELFVNVGRGFHSNDARGTTATVAPKEGVPIDPVTPLVRSLGSEVGLRTEIVPGLQSSLALWQLALGSELVFSGDAGDTSPSRPSRRRGLEWNNHWVATRWLLVDADLALSRARYTEPDPAGDFVPGAIDRVASLGATVTGLGRWSGQFQLRYFGPRPLVEDDSRRSRATTLAYLRVGYRLTKDARLALDLFNLFDRRASDIDYFYASRLRGEPAEGVADIHSHPVEPRSARVTLTLAF